MNNEEIDAVWDEFVAFVKKQFVGFGDPNSLIHLWYAFLKERGK